MPLSNLPRSKLIAYSIELEGDGIYRLAGIYRNEPIVELQGDRSGFHHGSLLLEIYASPANAMSGHYRTDHSTRGSMKITNKHENVFDTFESAQKALS